MASDSEKDGGSTHARLKLFHRAFLLRADRGQNLSTEKGATLKNQVWEDLGELGIT